MKKFFSASLGIHSAVLALILLLKPFKAEKSQLIKIISPKELEEKIKKSLQVQIVTTDPKQAKSNTLNLQKIFLAKETNKAAKNTQAKKSDKFINGEGEFKDAPKSISQKGKFSPEKVKGKGVSASDDFIEGAEIGPQTILNTQEFKYANYYERIKQSITENWRTFIRQAIKQVNSNPKKYGILEVGYKTTKLEVLLNAKGEILEIKILGQSSQEVFDEAAVKSFKKSEPFASPPDELVKNGQFTLRWNFTVNVESSGLIEFKGGQTK